VVSWLSLAIRRLVFYIFNLSLSKDHLEWLVLRVLSTISVDFLGCCLFFISQMMWLLSFKRGGWDLLLLCLLNMFPPSLPPSLPPALSLFLSRSDRKNCCKTMEHQHSLEANERHNIFFANTFIILSVSCFILSASFQCKIVYYWVHYPAVCRLNYFEHGTIHQGWCNKRNHFFFTHPNFDFHLSLALSL